MKPSVKHGMYGSPENRAWRNMLQRCQNPRDPQWHIYGGRGIIVCPRWNLFVNFYGDMGPRPSPKHSIDRIDVNGAYEPSNCRWATLEMQNNNTRRNVLLTWEGETMTLAQWGRRIGISPRTIGTRMRAGWPLSRILAAKNP
jgi:hypothetical protein